MTSTGRRPSHFRKSRSEPHRFLNNETDHFEKPLVVSQNVGTSFYIGANWVCKRMCVCVCVYNKSGMYIFSTIVPDRVVTLHTHCSQDSSTFFILDSRRLENRSTSAQYN